MTELKTGWTFDHGTGTICFFEHFPPATAVELIDAKGVVYVVGAINLTQAENRKTVHRNKYFALGLPSAVAMAARIEIDWQDVAEEVVGIRPVTPDEARLFLNVSQYFDGLMPPAISNEQAEGLQDAQQRRVALCSAPAVTDGAGSCHCHPRGRRSSRAPNCKLLAPCRCARSRAASVGVACKRSLWRLEVQ